MEPIRISYNTLSTAAPETLAAPLAQAFGSSPGCLGIVLIDDLPPDFPRLRENLLRLAHGFASLPPEAREDLARPETSYMFGWSHGKEIMNGTGEALSILTDGKLAATPHFVSGSASAPNVSRETFALFLQPDVDDVIGADGETFGAFTKRTLDEHYAHDQSGEAEA
ncbi:hypothetical protein P7C73_g1890, partial [Tremellales sp. Uapishka_1]